MPPPAITATGDVDEARLSFLRGRYSYATISDKISDIVLSRPTHWGWYAGVALCTLLTILFALREFAAIGTALPEAVNSNLGSFESGVLSGIGCGPVATMITKAEFI